MRETVLISLMIVAGSLNTSIGQVTNISVNIASGWNMLANPLDSGLTNGANEIFIPIDNEIIMTWENSQFTFVDYDTALGAWLDPNLNFTVPPSLPPGKGFMFFNPGSATTLIFSGRLVASSGKTNYLALPSGYSLLGSPLAANVTNITSLPVNLPIIDGMQILMFVNGTQFVTEQPYNYWSYDSGFGGWIDSNFNPQPAPSYNIGQGFFFSNPGPPTNWVQSLP